MLMKDDTMSMENQKPAHMMKSEEVMLSWASVGPSPLGTASSDMRTWARAPAGPEHAICHVSSFECVAQRIY